MANLLLLEELRSADRLVEAARSPARSPRHLSPYSGGVLNSGSDGYAASPRSGGGAHGGGAFSGKDPTKVDRSAAYAARYLAKNVVAAGLAERCTIQIAYAIGVAEPVSVYADTHGTGTADNASLEAAIAECMPLTPRNVREHLGLNKPIYAPSSAYGHFGRVAGEAGPGSFSWEAVDLSDKLAAAV